MQISDIFHNCPEEQEQEQQCNPKDLGSKFPRSKIVKLGWDLNNYRSLTEKLNILVLMLFRRIAKKFLKNE